MRTKQNKSSYIRKAFCLCFLVFLAFIGTACGTEKAKEDDFYLSITATRRNNGVDPTDGLTTTSYIYDIAREELSEAGQFEYTAQYPLSVYSRGDHRLYYTADDGTGNDQVFCYDDTSKNTYQLTDNLWAVNEIVLTEKSIIIIAVARGERELAPYIFDKETKELTKVQVYKDFTVKECGLDPESERFFIGGYLESQNYKDMMDFNDYLSEENLDYWETESTPTDSYLFELVDHYKKAEQRLFVEEHEFYGGILPVQNDSLFFQLSERAVASWSFPTTRMYFYNMETEELKETDLLDSLPIKFAYCTKYGGYYYILGSGKEGEEYSRAIYRYDPKTEELKALLEVEEDCYINNFYLCRDYKDTKVNFGEDMLWQQDFSGDGTEEENILDQLKEIRLSLPDEKGFVESTLIPELMLPGSIIYFTDDTHYIIVEGGISLDTQEKVDTYYNNRKQGVEDAIEKGYIVAPMERPSAGSCVTYGDDGAMYHIYSREKILSNELEWYYENNGCEAVVTGFHTKSPVVYYRLDGKEWMEYPLSKWEKFSDEELTQVEIIKIEKTEDKIVITAACGKEEVTEEIRTKEENILDQLKEIRLSLPDEKGFVETALIPELMLPGSIIYFTDDTHYIIVEGGISLDTQEKVDTYYNNRKQGVEDAIEKGYIVAPMERPSAGSCVTYGDDGAMYHIYSREKILSNELEWYYENNGCEAVVTGFHTKSPVVYYRLDGKEWMEYPLSKWEKFSDEELTQVEIIKIEKTEDKIVIMAACGKEEVTEEILFD